MGDARPRRLWRLDADDAGRAANRTARRTHARSQAPADDARVADRTAHTQRRRARPLSHARAVRRQSGGRAGRLARLFRQGGAPADDRRGGAAGGAAAGAGIPPSRQISRSRAPCPRARARPGRRARDHHAGAAAGGLTPRGGRGVARGEPIPQTRKDFPTLAAHAAEEAVAADPSAHVLRLSLDARLQAKLEALVKESVGRLGPKLSAAIVVIDNGSGEIRARIGAADYSDAQREGAIDMSLAPRSPGSALKPFIYALAFEQGLAHPETVLFDRPARYGAYAPQNFDLGYRGTVTARKALQMSLNLPAIEVLADVGPASFLARLHGAGAEIALPKDTPIGLAIGLGGLGISLVDIARLYSGLARGGEAPALFERLDGASPIIGPKRVTDPVAAFYIADILRGAPPPDNSLSRRIAFKTGTSYGFRDALAIGFDRGTTIAVWIGRPDNGPTPGLIGRQAAAPILFDAFERLGRNVQLIRPPKGVLRVATSADLPPPLRHLRSDAPKSMAATAATALKIAFPPDGARVDLGLKEGARGELSLKALGGALPLTWFVNGAPVGEPDSRRQSAWRPDGAGFARGAGVDARGAAGFARVSVIDARGATDSIWVRVE